MESLQQQLIDLAAKNIELTQRLATVEAASSATPTPQQVLLPSAIDTSLLKQPAVFDGDRTTWADCAFTFRAYASAVSTRMVVVMEHAQSATEPWDLPAAASDNQANAQLRYVLGMLVKDGAMETAGNESMGHGSEIWRLKCEEYEPRQRRRFRAMMSAENLWVSLWTSLRGKCANEDQSGKLVLDEILAATVSAGIDDATVAQHLALNDGTL